MKCTCGFERTPDSIFCRMLEVAAGKFLVRIYSPGDRLLAQSPESLNDEKAMEFLRRNVNPTRCTAHVHWESQIPLRHGKQQNAPPLLTPERRLETTAV